MTTESKTPVVQESAGTSSPSAARVEPEAHHGGGFFGGVKRFFGFLGWVLTGFGLIGALRRRQAGRSKAEEIVLYTVHRSFYLWGLILMGFVGAFCVRHYPGGEQVWGWIYVFVLLYT